MAFEIRRVITGHDDQGNAIVKRDEILKSAPRLPGYEAMTVWCTREFPANNNEDAFNDGQPGPKGQRVLMRISEMQPDQHSSALMHRTETLDYAVILSGEAELELDNGEKITGLKTGDVVIQRGTNHGWANRSSGPVRYLFILLDAEPVRVGDKVLGDFLDNLGGNVSPMPVSAS
jgi:quercetin dioxygenase-like cupin family protein